MSIAVKFYTFSKKKNSTKRPSGGTTENCNLLDDTSVTAPSIRLSYSGNPTSWNYAYIAYFHRYYFITDWVSDHNQWIATMAVDVLASFAADILASSQYVLRSASERNPRIADASYPMDTATTFALAFPFGSELIPGVETSGTPFTDTRYILGLSNSSRGAKICGVQYLCLEPAQLGEILYGTLNPQSNYWDPGGTSGVSDSIYRSIVNPLQYFGEAFLVPFTPLDRFLANVPDNELKVGSWNVPYAGTQMKCISGSTFGENATGYIFYATDILDLPQHPQWETHGDYLKASPYSRYYLYAGPFGMVRLDASYLTRLPDTDTFQVYIEVACDFKGGARLTVRGQNNGGPIMAKQYTNVAVPITLTQTKNNTIQWLGSAAGTVASAFSGNVVGTVGGAANLISGADNLINKPETKGDLGSTACIYEHWFIQAEFTEVVCNDGELPMNIIGYPLCETRQLSTLSGYCQTAEPWLDLDCYSSEYNEIMGFMTDGFYIEEPSNG